MVCVCVWGGGGGGGWRGALSVERSGSGGEASAQLTAFPPHPGYRASLCDSETTKSSSRRLPDVPATSTHCRKPVWNEQSKADTRPPGSTGGAGLERHARRIHRLQARGGG
jgi:hypothetical protein